MKARSMWRSCFVPSESVTTSSANAGRQGSLSMRIGRERKLGIDGHQFLVTELDHGVGDFSAQKSGTAWPYWVEGRESSSKRSRVTSPREPRDLAPPKMPSRVCAVWDICLPALLDFAELALNLDNLLAGVLQLVSHFALRVGSHLAGNLGGVLDGVLQGGSDAIEAESDAFGDGFQLSGTLGLRCGDGLQVADATRFICDSMAPLFCRFASSAKPADARMATRAGR